MFVQDILKGLREGRLTLEELKEFYGINIKEYQNKYILNYDQIRSDSQKFSDVVRVCRNLIISKDFKKVLHRSFDRFYNYGEDSHTAEFDISQAICDEKLDGSLIGLYHDYSNLGDFSWNFCTRFTSHAEGEIQSNIKRYETFWNLIYYEVILRNKWFNSDLWGKFNREYSYIFELVSPFNQNIKKYSETRLVLLAVREKETGRYIDREEEAERIGWPWLPRTYKFNSWEEIIESAKNLPELEEGYVCRIGDWRIKVKNPTYVAVSHLRENKGLNPRRIIELVKTREEEEYLSYYPEDRKYFEKYIRIRDGLPRILENEYFRVKEIETQKEFALAVQDNPNKFILFQMRSSGKSAVEILDSLNMNQIEKLYERNTEIN